MCGRVQGLPHLAGSKPLTTPILTCSRFGRLVVDDGHADEVDDLEEDAQVGAEGHEVVEVLVEEKQLLPTRDD